MTTGAIGLSINHCKLLSCLAARELIRFYLAQGELYPADRAEYEKQLVDADQVVALHVELMGEEKLRALVFAISEAAGGPTDEEEPTEGGTR